MAIRGTGRLLGVAVGFLALVGIGASAAHCVQEPYNPGILRFPNRHDAARGPPGRRLPGPRAVPAAHLCRISTSCWQLLSLRGAC